MAVEIVKIIYDANTVSLVKAQGQLAKTRVATNQLQAASNRVKSSFLSLGPTLIASLGAVAVFAAIRKAIKSISDLEFQMSKVQAVSRATNEQMVKLKSNAIAVASASKFTAREVGKLQEELARLGFTVTEIENLTDAVAALAIVADTSLGQAALVTAKTINAFALSATEGTRVVNTMAESFSRSALDINKFESAIGNVGPIARIAGLSLEETTAILALFVDNGIEASKAGTDLRRILLNVNLAGLTLDEALTRVNESSNEIIESFNLFGARAVVAGNLLAENRDRVKELGDELADTNQELDKMRRIMEDNLQTDTEKLTSAFDAQIQKGGGLNIVFRATVQALTQLVKGNTSLRDILVDINDEAIKMAEGFTELNETTKAVQNTVEQAFESEDIEAFIRALDLNINREEIILQIRRKQREEAKLEKELEEERFQRFKERQATTIEVLKNIALARAFVQKLTDEALADLPEAEALAGEELTFGGLTTQDRIDIEQSIADVTSGIREESVDDFKGFVDQETELNAIRAASAAQTAGLISNAFSQLAGDSAALLVFEKAATIVTIILNLQAELAKIKAKFAKNPVLAATLSTKARIAAGISLAATIATAIPKFKTGVIDYQGEGTGTSDSNVVRISHGESVMKARATSQSKELLKRINSEEINDSMFNAMVNTNFDNKELVAAMSNVDSSIKKLPIHQTFFNEKGVSNYILKDHARIKYLRNRMLN